MKKIFYITISTIFIFLLLEASIIFIVDPYQRYRKPFYNKIVTLDAYKLIPGILRNNNYTSAIIGSSMSQNFVSKEADSYFKNEKFINVTAGGAGADEITGIFKVVKERNINNVIINLDYGAFDPNRENKIVNYLYTKSHKEDFKYLLNVDSYMQIIRILLKPNVNPYNAFEWWRDYKFSKEILINDYKNSKKGNRKSYYEGNSIVEKSKGKYLETLDRLVRENKNIKFIVFYPPYSMVTYKNGEESESLLYDLEIKEFVIKNLLKYSNVEVYDFQHIEEITHNLDNYKDYSHYGPWINSLMLKYFSQKKYIATEENYKENIEKLMKQTKDYVIE